MTLLKGIPSVEGMPPSYSVLTGMLSLFFQQHILTSPGQVTLRTLCFFAKALKKYRCLSKSEIHCRC